jgi:enoyl-CoA hydratase/carnithine racemase
MSETEAPKVLVEREDWVGIITINRPDARNVIDPEVAAGIEAALDELDADPKVRAVVLTGAGEKAFCAGMDLRAFAKVGPKGGFFTEKGGFAGITSRKLVKPLVVAVNGAAFGGGLEILLAADCAIAASSAKFALPEVKVGMHAGAGGVIRLAKRIPRSVALKMVMSGEPISAQRALELGLVNEVVAPDQVRPQALRLARSFASASPTSVLVSRELMLRSLEATEEQAWDLNKAAARIVLRCGDAKEGPKAFAEKREPVWADAGPVELG